MKVTEYLDTLKVGDMIHTNEISKTNCIAHEYRGDNRFRAIHCVRVSKMMPDCFENAGHIGREKWLIKR